MKLFKFLGYTVAFLIGLTIAFCTNTNYDKEPVYTYQNSRPLIAQKTPSSTQIMNQNGKQLFKNNCAACHNRNMRDDLTGPALAGVRDRWQGREELLYEWIRNSQKMIASGDPYSIDLYNKWNKSVMTSFPNLTDNDIKDLLEYIDEVSVN